MRIKYLGTAAAEGIPALGCCCDICKEAWEKKGRWIRTRSQSVIDDRLLIDLPPDTYQHFIANNMRLDKIRNVIVTHVHGDHFSTVEISMFRTGFYQVGDNWPGLVIWGTPDIAEPLQKMMDEKKTYPGLEYRVMKPYEQYEIDGYCVTPLKAHHGTDNPYNYIISDGESSILYLHDSGWPFDETMEFLKAKGPFDLISYDCTFGCNQNTYENHMGLGGDIKLRDEFLKTGIAGKDTIHVLNHFTHNAPGVNPEDIEEVARQNGFVATYDNFEITT